MNISIRGSKLEITEAMKQYATEKLKKLEKYVENPESVNATVIVKIPNRLHKVEITIKNSYFKSRGRKRRFLQCN